MNTEEQWAWDKARGLLDAGPEEYSKHPDVIKLREQEDQWGEEVRKIPGGTLEKSAGNDYFFTTDSGISEELSGPTEFLDAAWEMAGMVEEFRELHAGMWVD
jgi:hypothetical protein